MKADDAMVPVRDDLIERLREALEAQMDQQDETLPSSVARERGLVWLSGWFDLRAADALASDAEGWRPIEEAPADGTPFLLGQVARRNPRTRRIEIEWNSGRFTPVDGDPQHFHPLPALPAPPSAMLSAVKAGV